MVRRFTSFFKTRHFHLHRFTIEIGLSRLNIPGDGFIVINAIVFDALVSNIYHHCLFILSSNKPPGTMLPLNWPLRTRKNLESPPSDIPLTPFRNTDLDIASTCDSHRSDRGLDMFYLRPGDRHRYHPVTCRCDTRAKEYLD